MLRMRKITGTVLTSLIALTASTPLEAATPQSRDQQVQIVAEDMCCQGCARKVSAQLYAARGVKEVGVDMKSRTVTVSLPQPSATTLGQLWHAVDQGAGGPTKLVTSEAIYTLVRPQPDANSVQQPQPNLAIVVDNLHCKGCAQKIAAQLYALKGVAKVSVDMQQETLYLETRTDVNVSPWLLVDAIAQANERPLAVSGPHGNLAIEWANKPAPKNHEQAQQQNLRGVQR